MASSFEFDRILLRPVITAQSVRSKEQRRGRRQELGIRGLGTEGNCEDQPTLYAELLNIVTRTK